MPPIILDFFPNNYVGNKYISFQNLRDPRGGVIFQNVRRNTVDACVQYIEHVSSSRTLEEVKLCGYKIR